MKNLRSSKNNTTPKKENLKCSDTPKSVFLIKENLLNFTKDNENSIKLQIKRLRHPGTGESSYFYVPKTTTTNIDSLSEQIFEIIEFNQKHRSWFINENVTSNGRLYMTLPIDSLFFVLYYLKKQCENQAKPLEQLDDDEYPITIDVILNFINNENLLKISDEKGPKNYKAYKYNHEKTMKWLTLKTKYLANILKLKKINTGISATSVNYIKGGEDDLLECDEDDYLRLASEIIGTYITIDLYDDLKKSLGISNLNKTTNTSNNSVIGTKKRKSLSNNLPDNKRPKIDNDNDDDTIKISNEITSPQSSIQQSHKLEKKQTTKDKSLAKAASGTKNIASFFQKKTS